MTMGTPEPHLEPLVERKNSEKPRVVVKIGTSSLVHDKRGALNLSAMCKLCEVLTDMRKAGYDVVMVSSGAVGAGCQALGVDRSQVQTLAHKQALAAVGQGKLLRQYDDIFTGLGQNCAQILINQENIATKPQYRNACNTFEELFAMDVIPIVNENDTLAVQELRFGDNDSLSAQVAIITGADWLFLLTDVDALYTSNPTTNPDARAVRIVEDINKLNEIVNTVECGSKFGTGGMATKMVAARLASAAGCATCILNSQRPEVMMEAIKGDRSQGTCIMPICDKTPKHSKKWILSILPKGTVKIDKGAVVAVQNRKSLFSKGIIEIEGDFMEKDAVKIVGPDDQEIGRGLTNYDSKQMRKVMHKNSEEFERILGFHGPDEIVSQYNIVRTSRGKSKKAALSYGDLTTFGRVSSPEGSSSSDEVGHPVQVGQLRRAS